MEVGEHVFDRSLLLHQISGFVGKEVVEAPLVVHGPSGVGKTALMSRAYLNTVLEVSNSAVIISRFIGTTDGSLDTRSLLYTLCCQIVRVYGSLFKGVTLPTPVPTISEVPLDMGGLIKFFPRCLRLATVEHPLVIFLDGLDQVVSADFQQGGSTSAAPSFGTNHTSDIVPLSLWFPRTIPSPHVRLIVSVTDSNPYTSQSLPLSTVGLVPTINIPLLTANGVVGGALDSTSSSSSVFQQLVNMFPAPENHLGVGPLSSVGVNAMLEFYGRRDGRCVTPAQKDVLVQACGEVPLPLFIELAWKEAASWTSFPPDTDADSGSNNAGARAPPTGQLSKPARNGPETVGPPRSSFLVSPNRSVQSAVHHLFDKLEGTYGKELVGRALGYITAAKRGLSPAELDDILSCDDVVLNKAFEAWSPAIRRFPTPLWYRIRYELGSLLVEMMRDGIPTYGWAHREFEWVAINRYLRNPARADAIHNGLASYWSGRWSNQRKPFRDTDGRTTREEQRYVATQPTMFNQWQPNRRKVGSLAYHELLAGRFGDAARTLLDFPSMEAAFRARMGFEHLSVYYAALREDPQVPLSNPMTPMTPMTPTFSGARDAAGGISITSNIAPFMEFLRSQSEFLNKHPECLIQHAANQPSRLEVSVAARKLLEGGDGQQTQKDPVLPWISWLNRPATTNEPIGTYSTWPDVESVDVSDCRIVAVSKDRVDGVNNEHVSIRLFDILTGVELRSHTLPLEGNLARVRFSLAGDRLAVGDGLSLRIFEAECLRPLTEEMWAHTTFFERIEPDWLPFGIQVIQWFDGDAKLATATGPYDEAAFGGETGQAFNPDEIPFVFQVLIWDAINYTKLKVVHSYKDAFPIASSPRAIVFRGCLITNGEPFWVDIEEGKVNFGVFPSHESLEEAERMNMLSKKGGGDGNTDGDDGEDDDALALPDLVDLQMFWPNIKDDYYSYKEGIIFRTVYHPMTCALGRHSPHALLWDPLVGVFLIDTIEGKPIGKLSLPYVALETQRTFPLIGPNEGKTWSAAISPDGKQIALPLDDGKVGIWTLPKTDKTEKGRRRGIPELERTQTVEGDWDFTFTEDGNFIVTTTVDKHVRMWRLDRSGVPESRRPAVWACDVQFMASRGPPGDGRKELALINESGLLYVVDVHDGSILWNELADADSRDPDDSIYMLTCHPTSSLILTVSTKCRLQIWLYDFTEKEASYVQGFEEIWPGTRITAAAFAPWFPNADFDDDDDDGGDSDVPQVIEITLAHQTGEITVWRSDLKHPPILKGAFGMRYRERGINSVIEYSHMGKYLVVLTSDGKFYVRHKDRRIPHVMDVDLGLFPYDVDSFEYREGYPCLRCGQINESLVAIGSDKSDVTKVIDLDLWTARELPSGPARDLAWLTDDSMVLVASSDGSMSLWDVATKQCVHKYFLDSLPSQISSLRFAMDDALILVKNQVSAGNNIFIFELQGQKNLPELLKRDRKRVAKHSTGAGTAAEDAKLPDPKMWTVTSDLMEGIVLRRDVQALKLLIDLGREQFARVDQISADVLSACCRYHDVSQFDQSFGLFQDPWVEGVLTLLKSGDADVKSQSARRALMFSAGFRSQQILRSLINGGVDVENDVPVIHDFFMEVLDDWYDELPKGRRSFMARIIEMTGERGIDALCHNEDAVLCTASEQGRNDVVRLCLEYGANIVARGNTPALACMSTENKDTLDILRGEGAPAFLKISHIHSWILRNMKENNYSFSTIGKIRTLLSQIGDAGRSALLFNDAEVLRVIVEKNDFNDLYSLMTVTSCDLQKVGDSLMWAALHGRDATHIVPWLNEKFNVPVPVMIEEVHIFTPSADQVPVDRNVAVDNGFLVSFQHDGASPELWASATLPFRYWRHLKSRDSLFYYFEAHVLSMNGEGEAVPSICIGVRGFDENKNPQRIIWHSTGECTFQSVKREGIIEIPCASFHQPFKHRDVVGCGFNPQDGSVFFTLNGDMVGRSIIARSMEVTADFHATVGGTVPCRLQVNAGTKPFIWSEALISQVDAFITDKSQSISLDPRNLHISILGQGIEASQLEKLTAATGLDFDHPPEWIYGHLKDKLLENARPGGHAEYAGRIMKASGDAIWLQMEEAFLVRLACGLGRTDFVRFCMEEGVSEHSSNNEPAMMCIAAGHLDTLAVLTNSTEEALQASKDTGIAWDIKALKNFFTKVYKKEIPIWDADTPTDIRKRLERLLEMTGSAGIETIAQMKETAVEAAIACGYDKFAEIGVLIHTNSNARSTIAKSVAEKLLTQALKAGRSGVVNVLVATGASMPTNEAELRAFCKPVDVNDERVKISKDGTTLDFNGRRVCCTSRLPFSQWLPPKKPDTNTATSGLNSMFRFLSSSTSSQQQTPPKSPPKFPNLYYFEVKIAHVANTKVRDMSKPKPVKIAIGVVPSEYSAFEMVGMGPASVGCHSDNGVMYQTVMPPSDPSETKMVTIQGKGGFTRRPTHTTATSICKQLMKGDVLGCAFDVIEGTIKFVLNGKPIGQEVLVLPSSDSDGPSPPSLTSYHAAIAVVGNPCRLDINVGQDNFVWADYDGPLKK
ncbi:NACHT domain- and WD repeat-containing protein 1 [Quaeritorhiza haematococci]|nr:NACHT domain- and WD repeat-containing protein 1 [Quaeritorhiza haematococci]